MRYTWDPEKDALNRRKHGLSLEEGIPALEEQGRDFWIDDRLRRSAPGDARQGQIENPGGR